MEENNLIQINIYFILLKERKVKNQQFVCMKIKQ